MEVLSSLTFALLWVLVTCQPELNESLESKLAYIFGHETTENTVLQILEPTPRPQDESRPGLTAGCKCVPFNLCESLSKVGVCQVETEVCCEEPSQRTPNLNIPEKGCGVRNVESALQSPDENEAQFGEFPWMVAVLMTESFNDGTYLNMYIAGGALIHEHVVLTAAHQVDKRDRTTLKVRAGEWDAENDNEIYPHQDRSVVDIIIHEEYDNGTFYNDVALLVVDTPFKLGRHINIVCLPQQDDLILSQNCFATGWGKDAFGHEGKYHMTLKKVELAIVRRKQCQRRLRLTKLSSEFILHDSFICAGGEIGKDTCKGDGGSPLVCPLPGTKNRYQQVGIVAWGIRCYDEIPAVYVNVAKFRKWIDTQMSTLKYTPEY